VKEWKVEFAALGILVRSESFAWGERMSLPPFKAFIRPVLHVLNDGRTWHRKDLADAMVAAMQLSPEAQTHQTGQRLTYRSRTGWVVSYLYQAGALERPSRGYVQINDRGRQLLVDYPQAISVNDLKQFPQFAEFMRGGKGSGNGTTATPEDLELSPVEQLISAVDRLNGELAEELLARLRSERPEFLEVAILKLLTAMGYGAAQHLGRSGDEGFDGVINQDALGLDQVFIQAKRWRDGSTVGRPDIQAFVGALQGAAATRGVFITTSKFSADARQYVTRIPSKVILIDGPELARLMINHEVGVQTRQSIAIREIDEDFFETE
jgi:restriction system protein